MNINFVQELRCENEIRTIRKVYNDDSEANIHNVRLDFTEIVRLQVQYALFNLLRKSVFMD